MKVAKNETRITAFQLTTLEVIGYFYILTGMVGSSGLKYQC